MNQADFRQLLSTPRTASTSASPDRTLGGGIRRRLDSNALQAERSTSFKPRANDKSYNAKGKSKESSSNTAKLMKEGNYVDRAALRRQESDSDALREPKGLDLDLLQQEKEAQSLEQDRDVEDLLEAIVEGRDGDVAQEMPESVSADSKQSKKRSRAELLKERIAANRQEAQQSIPEADDEGAFRSKFRKVGEKPQPQLIKIDPATGKVKKLRKKKKAAVETEPPAAVITPEPIDSRTRPEPPSIPSPPAVAQPEPALPQAEVDDDMDIFADAGGYGLSGSESEAEEGVRTRPDEPTRSDNIPAAKISYFDDDAEDIHADPIAGPVIRKREPTPTRNEEKDEEEQTGSMRLQGLSSGSGIDVQALLQADKDAEKEEKRKARKAKYAKVGLDGRTSTGELLDPEMKNQKKLTEADKLNKAHHELENYMSKKNKSPT